MNNVVQFTHRIATHDDVPAILALMKVAIAENMKGFLSSEEITAAQATMGLDTSLIDDQTYFVIETKQNGAEQLVGCGGWGMRKTLFGGNHTVGRDDRLSDPKIDAARIRAMYTHPNWTRRTVGTLLLDLGEKAARDAGFKTIELGSTIPGEPLYAARGYQEVRRMEQLTENGAKNVIIVMRKQL